MIKSILVIIICLLLNSTLSYSQDFHLKDLKLYESKLKLNSPHFIQESQISNDLLKGILLAFPFNPILQLQNKRFYAGITKEVSFGFFPYGRIALEYSLIFRETRLNQVRASYNFDFPLETGDLFAFLLSVGGGYFTDFYDIGYFPQASLSLLLPVTDKIGSLPYIKVRETFMTKDSPDIFDFSFGFGMYITF